MYTLDNLSEEDLLILRDAVDEYMGYLDDAELPTTKAMELLLRIEQIGNFTE